MPDTTPPAEAQQTTAPAPEAGKTDKPKVSRDLILSAAHRAALERIEAELKVPGTRLGALARSFKRLAIDGQEALNNHGGDVLVAKVLDHEERVPVRVGLDLALHVQVGKGQVKTFPISLLHLPDQAKEDKPKVADAVAIQQGAPA